MESSRGAKGSSGSSSNGRAPHAPTQPAIRRRDDGSSDSDTNKNSSGPSKKRRLAPTVSNQIMDNELPPKVEEYVPESKLYGQLVDYEKRLDAVLSRKRMDTNAPPKVRKLLRIFLSNLASNQPNDQEDKPLAQGVPSWTFRIEGRALELSGTKSRQPLRRFSAFLKSIFVELDSEYKATSEARILEWHRTASSNECDGFEVKRKGDKDVRAKVIIHLDHQPEKFKVTPELAEIVGSKLETKQNIILAVWQYIRTNRLQDMEERSTVNCDEKLKQVFGKSRVPFPSVSESIQKFLAPPDPIVLEYTIRVDRPFNAASNVYDIEVEMEDLTKQRPQPNTASPAIIKELSELDEKIANLLQQISQCRLKRDFMNYFAENPVGLINRWIASQCKDLDAILAESPFPREEQRRADYYQQPWVNEAVFHYVSERIRARMNELNQIFGTA